ncbi:MAG: F0F1 ATP synthase subunit gamma [Rhodospirillales bacterium]|nr:F0F1 ATP synthase subunit gamma [Rhodospirillales bacterium]
MPSLKSLRTRINSVKSTRKITSAMKMVAAAKLRRAQEQAQAARPYAERMERMLGSLAASLAGGEGGPALLAGTGKEQTYLIVAVSSDRGLCGGFNGSIARFVRNKARKLIVEGKTVKILCVGRKARDILKRDLEKNIVGTIDEIGRPQLGFHHAEKVAQRILHMYEAGEFDVCSVVYNRFKSAISQIVTDQQLIPFAPPVAVEPARGEAPKLVAPGDSQAIYEYEPDEGEILADLLPRNLSVQIYRALLESNASEHGARMTAMDNATRNAGDMINRLTLNYNRTRQAIITKELIEIISGAEAV